MAAQAFQDPIYRYLTYAGQIILAGIVVALLVMGKLIGAAVVAAFLAVSFAYYLRQGQIPNLFDLLFVVVAIVNGAGWVLNWFQMFRPWYDEFAHFLTTAAVALVLFYVFYQGDLLSQMEEQTWVFVASLATLALGIGALWELVEYVAHLLLNVNLNRGVDDVMTDLAADLMGAILAVIVGLWYRDQRQASSTSWHGSGEGH